MKTTKLNHVATRILSRLIAEDVEETTMAGGAQRLKAELERDYDEVRRRYCVMSTGEKVVALAWLYRCDYSNAADEWSHGFLSALAYTSGDHKTAALQLLGG